MNIGYFKQALQLTATPFDQRGETSGIQLTHTPQVASEVPAFDKVAKHCLVEADGEEVGLKPERQEIVGTYVFDKPFPEVIAGGFVRDVEPGRRFTLAADTRVQFGRTVG